MPWLIDTLERFKDYEILVQYHTPAYPVHGRFHNPKSILIRNQWTPLFDKYETYHLIQQSIYINRTN